MQASWLLAAVKTSLRKTVNASVDRLSRTSASDKFRQVYDKYEEFLGIKEVRKTQQNVLSAEARFVEANKIRRGLHNELNALQAQIKQVRQKLDSTYRSDEAYLDLITNEHRLIKSEIKLIEQSRSQEETERDHFNTFSQTLRDAHEVERLRQEKTKYLSLMGSIVGAVLGIVATSINHAMKMNDLKRILTAIEAQNNVVIAKTTEVLDNENELNLVEDKDVVVKAVPVSDDISSSVTTIPSEQFRPSTADISDISAMLSSTESNLEYRMKLNTLATVVGTYALIAITFPIVLRLLGD